MNTPIKKLLSTLLLGICILPSISFAALDNPFDSVQKTVDMADTPAVSETNPNPVPAVNSATTPTSSVVTPLSTSYSSQAFSDIVSNNKDIKGEAKEGDNNAQRYEKLSDFANKFNDKIFSGGNNSTQIGEKGARNFLITVARDAKNFFTVLAFVFIIIAVLVFFFGSKGEEDAKKVKNAVIYATLGIMLMQVSYVFINTLYNKDVGVGGGATGIDFYKAIILPIINLVRVLASFAFLAMAFMTFFTIVTAGGDPKAREKGINTIVASIIGFVLIKLADVLVTSVYGKINCPSVDFAGVCTGSLLTDPNLSDTLKIATTIVNYVNGFIGLATLLIIMYAGWHIMFGGEEGVKKGKSMIKWIVVGLLLLVTSYILFNFFILKS